MQNKTLDRLDQNLQKLRQEAHSSSSGFQPETPQQRIAQEMIVDTAVLAANNNIPEQPAVETFTRAYRSGSPSAASEQWRGGESESQNRR